MVNTTLLATIIGGDYRGLLLIAISYLWLWTVMFLLALRLSGKRFVLAKMSPGILTLVLYCLPGKAFLPDYVYIPLLVAVFTYMVKTLTGINVMKALWVAVFSELCAIIGTMMIIQPIFMVNKNAMVFLTQTPVGISVGTLLEMVFPAIVLFFFHQFNRNLTPPFTRKVTQLDVYNIVLFGLLFAGLYNLAFIFLHLMDRSAIILMLLLSLELLTSVAALVVFYLVRNQTRRQREQEYAITLLKQGELLKKALTNQENEYRDQLQTITLYAAIGNVDEIIAYVGKIGDQLNTAQREAVQQSFFAPVILAQQLTAWKKGVEIITRMESPLDGPDLPILNLGMTVNTALELMVAEELDGKTLTKTVSMHVREDACRYYFEFHSSQRPLPPHYQKVFSRKGQEQPAKGKLEQMRRVEELVLEMNGDCEYLIQDKKVLRIVFSLPKKIKTPFQGKGFLHKPVPQS